MIPTLFSRLVWGGALLAGALVFLCPAASMAGVQRGLALCAQSVTPALFPYMVVCALLLGRGGLFLGLPLRPLARLMGQKGGQFPLLLLLCWLGGFASAAACISSALGRGLITRRQACILCFCGLYASPAFVLNAAGAGLWPGAGGLLLASGAAGALVCCLLAPLFCRGGGTASSPVSPPPSLASPPSLSAAVEQTTLAMVKICGFVVFFSFLAGGLSALLPFGAGFAALAGSFLEMTGGCAACRALSGADALYATRAALSWLGVCAFFQADALLPAGLPRGPLVWGRLVHMAASLCFLALFARLWPGLAPVYSSLSGRVIPYARMQPDAALALFALCCLAAARLEREQKAS